MAIGEEGSDMGPWPNLCRAFGDVNAVGNRIAEEYYKHADVVLTFSRIDRAATHKQSLEWLLRVLRDLPSGSLFYVCTKADDVARDEIIYVCTKADDVAG